MEREAFKRGIRYRLEQEIFEKEKDCPIANMKKFTKEIKEKYNYTPDYNLYSRIVNYQVAKYGKMIDVSFDRLGQEECNRRANIVRIRKYRRLGKRK